MLTECHREWSTGYELSMLPTYTNTDSKHCSLSVNLGIMTGSFPKGCNWNNLYIFGAQPQS